MTAVRFRAVIVVVLAAVLIALLWGRGSTGSRSPVIPRTEPPVAAAPPEAFGSVSGARGGTSPGGPAAPVPDASGEPASPAPEDIDPAWRTSKVVFRLREMGAVAPFVDIGLRAAREEMRHCFDAEGASPGAEGAPAEPATLLLYLESREGAIDVVDARTDDLGTSSRALVDCCREVLRGYEIAAAGVVPGRRYRVKYVLQ